MKLDRIASTLLVVAGVLAPLEMISGGESLVLRLPETRYARESVPVSFDLPDRLKDTETLSLERIEDGEPIAVQRNLANAGRLIWMLEQPLPAGHSRRYRLRTGSAETTPADVDPVACRDDGQRLKFYIGKQPVLAYNYATMPSPDPAEPYYARSGFIHPLFNPEGQVLTDDFPPDHWHQHAVMFAWTNAEFRGHPVNFWDQAKQQGRIEHVRFEPPSAVEPAGADQRLLPDSPIGEAAAGRSRHCRSTVSGPVFGGFTAVLRHVDISVPGRETAVLEERWHVRIYRRTDGFLFDLESEQACAAEEPLTINQYHYGGMAIRGRRNWIEAGQGEFLTSQGKTRSDGNHSRPNWCDVHGLVDGRQTGVTLFCHPENFRAPQPVRLHPTKPYFCWAPMVLGPFDIKPGERYVSRYRFFAHNGPVDPDEADRLWQDYVHPAVAVLVDD